MAMNHCQENDIPRLLIFAAMSEIAGLAATKPFVFVAGREDPMFPIEATRRAFREFQQIHAASGAEDRCPIVVWKPPLLRRCRVAGDDEGNCPDQR